MEQIQPNQSLPYLLSSLERQLELEKYQPINTLDAETSGQRVHTTVLARFREMKHESLTGPLMLAVAAMGSLADLTRAYTTSFKDLTASSPEVIQTNIESCERLLSIVNPFIENVKVLNEELDKAIEYENRLKLKNLAQECIKIQTILRPFHNMLVQRQINVGTYLQAMRVSGQKAIHAQQVESNSSQVRPINSNESSAHSTSTLATLFSYFPFASTTSNTSTVSTTASLSSEQT